MIEDQLTSRGRLENCETSRTEKKRGAIRISSSHIGSFWTWAFWILVFTSRKKKPGKTALWVERHDLQGNLDIQPPINRCNQLDFCPSRAVAFQCPETSNRHKWQVESYLGCFFEDMGRSEMKNTQHTQV